MIASSGKHDQVGAGVLGRADGGDDPLGVAAEVADHRVDLAERHAKAGHEVSAYGATPSLHEGRHHRVYL